MAQLLKTPKNLQDAILNGINQSPVAGETMARRALTISEQSELAADIEPFVRDFVCDKLTCAMIEQRESTVPNAIHVAYRKITGEQPKPGLDLVRSPVA